MLCLRPVLAGLALCTATMAHSAYEFYVKVKGAGQDAPDGPVYLLVEAERDAATGASREGMVRLACDGDRLRNAGLRWTETAPRRGGNTPDTERKMMGAPKIGEATALTSIDLPKITPKIAKESHGRAAAPGWQPIDFADPAAACAAAAEAAAIVKKSKSNISTN